MAEVGMSVAHIVFATKKRDISQRRELRDASRSHSRITG